MRIGRRKFITGASLLAGSLSTGHTADRLGRKSGSARPGKIQKISEVTRPLAITMVDYS